MNCFFTKLLLIGGCAAAFLNAGELTFEQTLLEVTAQPDQETVEVVFSFEVTGEGEAKIARHDAPCSCLEAEISDGGRLVWQEGEKGSVRALFKTGNFRGTVDKRIIILMKGGTQHELTVRMTMPELLVVKPKTLKWAQGEEPSAKSFDLIVQGDEPMKILKLVSTSGEKFPYELETIEEGKHYQITVTPASTEGRGFGLIRIATDSQFKNHQNYQAYVVIAKQLAK